MHWMPWQKAIAKWSRWVWLALGRASAGDEEHAIAAIDGTVISRSHPSQYYQHRIDREGKVPCLIQREAMINVKRRKVLSWRIRAKQRGETCAVPYLI